MERQPLPAVSDDSDSASEREPDEAKESDDSEKDGGNTSKSPSETDEIEVKQELKDIALSESDSDKETDEEPKVIFSQVPKVFIDLGKKPILIIQSNSNNFEFIQHHCYFEIAIIANSVNNMLRCKRRTFL